MKKINLVMFLIAIVLILTGCDSTENKKLSEKLYDEYETNSIYTSSSTKEDNETVTSTTNDDNSKTTTQTNNAIENNTNTSTETLSQRNAKKMAKEYLNTMAFSHDGLVEQLEYEQFSHEDAVYGADNCGANWNEQAKKMAEEYLDAMAFSRNGLIEQLEYDKFTHEQAVFGVDAVGL